MPDQFRADQNLKHFAKDVVQMVLNYLQAWGISHLSRVPVTVFDHPLRKEMHPNVQSTSFSQKWDLPYNPFFSTDLYFQTDPFIIFVNIKNIKTSKIL